ncbi:MAG: hypothetical protein JWN24_381 [Phycisphaerales bacterium]|nr:hypothetical protein [Phycisphaerales bacterium]
MSQEEDIPDYMKAINVTLTPPEEDLKRPGEDIPKVPLPEVVPIKTLDEQPSAPAADSPERSNNPDNAPGDNAANPGTQSSSRGT